MSDKKKSELSQNRKNYSDLLELAIVFGFLFLVISIYVPRAIWDEEEYFEDKFALIAEMAEKYLSSYK